MAAWVIAFGALEERIGTVFHRFEEWTFADELIDLVRWVGWIPAVMLACRALPRPARPPTDAARAADSLD